MTASNKAERVTAALLVIGDEILSGRTKDQNIGNLADHLTGVGIALCEVRVVGDQQQAIVDAVNQLRERVTYLFTTGGLGPTHDDITADSIAAAFGVDIGVDERAVALMQPYYVARGLELTLTRLRMARIPHGAELIENPVSAAPGFRIGNVIVLPGIPETARLMLPAATARLTTGPTTQSQSLFIGQPESEIAELFAAHQREFPEISMSSYPQYRDGRFHTELVLRATDQRSLAEAVRTLRAKLVACGHSPSG